MSHRLLTLALCVLVSSVSLAGDWPQWRGPSRDGIADEGPLLNKWPKSGPKQKWQVKNVGAGYSSMAISKGRLVTQGDLNGIEHIICLDTKTGKRLWAVQIETVKAALLKKVADQLARMDRNKNGVVEEVEALSVIGTRLFQYDTVADKKTSAAERATKVFAALDKNKDGKLSYPEVQRIFRRFQNIDQADKDGDADKLAAKRLASYFKKLDKDDDGKISRQESRRSIVQRFFNRADKRVKGQRRGDGFITKEEMKKYLLGRFEAKKDGVISTKELTTYYTNRVNGGDGILSREELVSLYGGYRNGQGDGPRGTPTIENGRVYVEGGNGDVACLDIQDGKTLWSMNLRTDFGGRVPGWGYCESPLIEKDMLILTPGGSKGAVIAVSKTTGEMIWRSKQVGQPAHYASAVAADIGGVRQIVQFARGSVFGVRANDGKLMWQYSGANNGTANAATPIVYQDHVFASSAYGTGGGLARISGEGDKQKAKEVYFEKKMANHHGGIVKVGDYMYGFGQRGLICMHYLTGKIAWTARSVRKGSLIVADNKLFLLGERHEVALAEVTPEEYRELGRFRIKRRGRPSWAHPVIANGTFYIRDQGYITAYDVKK